MRWRTRHRSADFQSAVSQICNLRGATPIQTPLEFPDVLPDAIRRCGRLQTCATRLVQACYPSGRFLRLFSLATLLALPFTVLAKKNLKFPVVIEDGLVQLAEMPKDDFKECSGLAVSRQFPGVLWTHNDGTDRRLFAINREGEKLAEFEVNGVFIWDFEDIALDTENRLYVADTGNNLLVRPRLTVYRMTEPDPKNTERALKVEAWWSLEFPKEGFDAEGIFIWKDHGYLVSKTPKDDKARLYRWPLSAVRKSLKLEEIGKLEVKSQVTGADISHDGKKLGLVATDGAYVIDIPGDIETAIKQEAYHTKTKKGQIEGCAFDKDGLLAIAESRELFLFNAKEFIPEASD
jgi:hypothetical protein